MIKRLLYVLLCLAAIPIVVICLLSTAVMLFLIQPFAYIVTGDKDKWFDISTAPFMWASELPRKLTGIEDEPF